MDIACVTAAGQQKSLGMPVEGMIKTADRKVISYLVKPLQDQISRAFREK